MPLTPLETSKPKDNRAVKWLGLILFLMTTIGLVGWLRTAPRQAPMAWGLLTLLPFILDPFNLIVGPYAFPFWSGYVKGWEFSLLDAVAIGVLLGTKGRWPRMVLVLPILCYLVVASLAVFQARFPTNALAYPIQLVRVLIVFLAVARVAQADRGERALLTGLMIGLTIQASYALVARAGGAFQTGGSLGHQNLLGYVSHMALMPLLGVFLARRMGFIALIGVLAGITVVILTGSRATILLAGPALIMTLLLSMVLRFNAQKVGLGVIALLLVGVSAPLAWSTIERRAATSPQGTLLDKDQERLAFERAATLILTENPMGIGPNHYVFTSITEGYADRAGVNWSFGNRSAHVHHSYLLVAAETGYLGLITMICLLGSALWYAFRTAFRYRREPEADVLLGLGFGLLAITLHSFVEWMFVTYVVQYVFAASLGLIVGLRSRLLAKTKAVPAKRTIPSLGHTDMIIARLA